MRILPWTLLIGISLGCKGEKNAIVTPAPAVTPALVTTQEPAALASGPKKTPRSALKGVPLAKDSRDCTLDEVKKSRAKANALIKAQDYVGAVLEFKQSACWYANEEVETEESKQQAWYISDLTYALYKAGFGKECYSIASRHSSPYSGNVSAMRGAEDKVVKALAHNEGLCRKLAMKPFEGFSHVTCSFGKQSGVPLNLLPNGVEEVCVADLGGDLVDDAFTHKGLELAIVKNGTKTSKKVTVASADCNLEKISFKNEGNKLLMQLAGAGRDCDEGTASYEYRTVVELDLTSGKTIAKDELIVAHH